MTYNSLAASPCRLALVPKHGDHGRSPTSFAEVCSRCSELCTSCVLIDILSARLFSGQKRTGHLFRLLKLSIRSLGGREKLSILIFNVEILGTPAAFQHLQLVQ